LKVGLIQQRLGRRSTRRRGRERVIHQGAALVDAIGSDQTAQREAWLEQVVMRSKPDRGVLPRPRPPGRLPSPARLPRRQQLVVNRDFHSHQLCSSNMNDRDRVVASSRRSSPELEGSASDSPGPGDAECTRHIQRAHRDRTT
jgi:hypothetical protein